MENSDFLVSKIKEIVQRKMKGVGPSHDFSHVMRVYRLCMEIAKEYRGRVDAEVLKLAALLHDVAREREDRDKTGKICHATESAREAEKILKKFGYPEERIEKVKYCILAHRFRTNVKPKTLEAKILFDADKLDMLGAVGIARSFMTAGKYGQKIYPEIPLKEYVKENLTDGRLEGRIKDISKHSPVFEFETKIKHIPEKLYTERAKRMAEKRVKFMREFFKRLEGEIKGEDGVCSA